jgi:hypothetical protein
LEEACRVPIEIGHLPVKTVENPDAVGASLDEPGGQPDDAWKRTTTISRRDYDGAMDDHELYRRLNDLHLQLGVVQLGV